METIAYLDERSAEEPCTQAQDQRRPPVSASLELGDDWRAWPPVTPVELADAFPTPRARQLVIDALVIPACIETEVSAAALATVRSAPRDPPPRETCLCGPPHSSANRRRS